MMVMNEVCETVLGIGREVCTFAKIKTYMSFCVLTVNTIASVTEQLGRETLAIQF
jgi:hypothetical protein